jgi:DNA-binding MarR family transcriptional regulator
MFDSNDAVDNDVYWLGFTRSREDLAAIGGELREGLRVVIYMTDELEMEALLAFDPDRRVWLARGERGTVRHYPAAGAAEAPLPTQLSQTLVALTIEIDNAFESRMPSRTTVSRPANDDPTPPGWGYKPWLISWAMWANFLQHVDPSGSPLAEIRRRSRLTPSNLKMCVNGLTRWGYLSERGAALRLTPAGEGAAAILAGLEAEIVARWAARLGAKEVEALRSAIEAVCQDLELDTPAYLPFLGHDLTAQLVTPRQAGGPPNPTAGPLPLTTLLSKVLLAFTVEFEAGFRPSLAHCANLIEVLYDDSPVPHRALSWGSGISDEAIRWILKQLEKAGIAETSKIGAVKHVRLTSEGAALQALYRRRLADIEADWSARHRAETIEKLRRALTGALNGPALLQALEPPPRGWRATAAPITTLPHHPMILHRGGYPDGA